MTATDDGRLLWGVAQAAQRRRTAIALLVAAAWAAGVGFVLLNTAVVVGDVHCGSPLVNPGYGDFVDHPCQRPLGLRTAFGWLLVIAAVSMTFGSARRAWGKGWWRVRPGDGVDPVDDGEPVR